MTEWYGGACPRLRVGLVPCELTRRVSEGHLAADQQLVELYGDADGWARKAILNVAGSGKFSNDRTIAEYAADIWGAEPCPVS